MTASRRAELDVNGTVVEVDVRPGEPLLSVLRGGLGLRGAKEACGRGECGACTVLLDGVPVMSCVLMVEEAEDGRITTVEGLADEHRELRRAFAETGGFQCGFCTPGQVVRAGALLGEAAGLSDEELRVAMSGNICRCTGYTQIVGAIRRAAGHRESA
ncbi:(2Fe-2S)-binding protein [Actinomadura sp. GC306]|uniref:(2Fe-2S)-binding protein n=1 Tax=Actinomadura sp. GC306 TaxID=2530367 RepID=UPI00104DE5ED|nr:(2Fe-2S)-binding protein [Actinomadura sp. GC306]TDC62791.1 (2Fe-2S)-binding protein [Actinomadura sp. GC306]